MLHETYKTLLTFFKDVSFQTINKGIRNLKKKIGSVYISFKKRDKTFQ